MKDKRELAVFEIPSDMRIKVKKLAKLKGLSRSDIYRMLIKEALTNYNML